MVRRCGTCSRALFAGGSELMITMISCNIPHAFGLADRINIDLFGSRLRAIHPKGYFMSDAGAMQPPEITIA